MPSETAPRCTLSMPSRSSSYVMIGRCSRTASHLAYQKEAEKGPLGTVEPMFSWKESCLTPTFNRKYHIIHPK